MNTAHIRQLIKPWMLPLAMLCGILFHSAIETVLFLSPYLIFAMLLITFCKVDPRHVRPDMMSLSLLSVQILGAIAVYFAIRPASEIVAQGVFICVFCPTATAAPVITGMLGGSVPKVAMYSIVSNTTVALTAPALLEYMAGESAAGEISFIEGFTTICSKVGPLIITPMLVAFVLAAVAPKVHGKIAGCQSLSFYLWAVALLIIVGNATGFIMSEPAEAIPTMLVIASCSLAVCIIQFIAGRLIGRHFGDRIAGAQGLGQKNTVLAVWMALTFLNPIASVGPASYILWQNIINSAQLYFKTRSDTKEVVKRT